MAFLTCAAIIATVNLSGLWVWLGIAIAVAFFCLTMKAVFRRTDEQRNELHALSLLCSMALGFLVPAFLVGAFKHTPNPYLFVFCCFVAVIAVPAIFKYCEPQPSTL